VEKQVRPPFFLDASGRALPAVLSPPSFACPMPNASGRHLSPSHKTLPLRPASRYNSHSPRPSGSVQAVLPGGPTPAVVRLFCVGPVGQKLTALEKTMKARR